MKPEDSTSNQGKGIPVTQVEVPLHEPPAEAPAAATSVAAPVVSAPVQPAPPVSPVAQAAVEPVPLTAEPVTPPAPEAVSPAPEPAPLATPPEGDSLELPDAPETEAPAPLESVESAPAGEATPVAAPPAPAEELEDLESPPPATADDEPTDTVPRRSGFSPFRYNRLAFRVTGLALLVILLIGVGSIFLASRSHNQGQTDAQQAANYSVGSIPLGSVKTNDQLQIGEVSQLAINGQLKVNDTLVVTPGTAPAHPVAGQIYYDQATNEPYYYNGTQFISLAPQHVTSLGGASGVIGLGQGLSVSGGQLSLSANLLQQIASAGAAGGPRVTSLQGQTGDVTLSAGPGISINGTVISNSGVVSLASGSSNLTVTSDGQGNYTVSEASGSGSVTSITGTANQINVSSNTGNVVLSLPQDIAPTSTPTFNGITLTGISPNGILYTDGSNVIRGTGSANDSVLVTDGSGVPSLSQTLPAQVQANITQTGTLTGGSITAGFGVISTVNNITTTALLQSGSLEVTGGNFTVDTDGNVVASGDVSIQGPSGITIGVPGTTAGSIVIANGSNGHTTTLQALASATQDQTITIPVSTVANDQICLLTLGNCVGAGGGVTSVGTQNYIPKFTNAAGNQVGNSLLYDNGVGIGVGTTTPGAGYLLDVNGNLNTAGGATVGNGLTITAGGATITGDVTQTGSGAFTTGNGAVSLNGDTTVGGSHTLTVGNGAVSFGGTLGVTGATNLNGGLSVTNGATITGATNINTTGTAATFIGNASGTFGLASTGLNVSTLGALSGVTGYDQASGDFTQHGSGSFSTGSGAVNLNGATTISSDLSVQGSGGISVGVSSATTGAIVFYNSSGPHTITLEGPAADPTGNYSLTLPTLTGDDVICTVNSGNCAGSGGGITGSGTGGTIPLFSGSGTSHAVTDSILTQSGTTVTVGGTLTATALQGDGSGVTNVDAVTLQGHDSSYFTNASNISSGTLADARLSTNVALLNGTNNFTGSLQHNGHDVCDDSNNCNYAPSSGSGNYIWNGTVAQTADFNITGTGTVGTLAVTGGASVGGDLDVTGDLTGGTYNGQTIGSAANFTGTLSVATSVSTPLLNITAGAYTVGISSAAQANNVTLTIPADTNTTDTICLESKGNCSGASGPAGGDLSGTYPNPTVVGIQNNPVVFTSLTAGDVLQYDGTDIVNGKITNTNFAANTVLGNVTGVGALTSGSIASGFGTISTTSNIATTATVQGGTVNATTALELGGADINTPGTLTHVAYLTATSQTFTGVNTFSAAGTALSVTHDASIGGTGTIGTLAVTNNAGVGGNLSVTGTSTLTGAVTGGTYNGQTISSAANFTGTLAVASDTTIGGTLGVTGDITGGTYNGATITSTTFNTAIISGGSLTGGSVSGGSLTGTAVNNLNVSGTAISGTGALSISAGGTNQDLSLQGSGTGGVIIQTPTFHNANGATYSFDASDASGVNATICTSVGNCSTSGAAGGDLSGTYPNPTVVGIQNNPVVFTSLTAGDVLQYDGTDIVNGKITNTNFAVNTVLGNVTGVGALTSGSIASGFGTIATASDITTTALLQGNVVNATGAGAALELNGADINTGGTLTNVAYLDQANSFSQSQTISATGATALQLTASNGGITFGGDTTLFRSGTLYLKTNGSLQVAGSNLNILNNSGRLTFGTGSDTDLYRASAGLLETDGSIYVDTNISAGGTLAVTGTSTLTGQLAANGGIVTNNAAINAGTGTITSGAVNGQTISSAANFTGTLAVATSISTPLLNITSGSYNVGISSDTQTGNVALTIPVVASGSDEICLKGVGNCSGASGAAGGDLTGTYPNPQIAKLQGTPFLLSTLASGQVLQYDGTNWVNDLITDSNLQAGTFANITGTGALTAGSIGSGFGTISTGNNITTTATVQGGVVNATTALELGGADINTGGTLTNVAYLDQANSFSQSQTITAAGGKTTLNLTSTGSNTGITFGGDTTLYRSSAGTLKTDGGFALSGQLTSTQSSTGNNALYLNVSGDSNARFAISGSGTLHFGSGAAATDTTLYRSAASTLKTDGSFVVGTNLSVTGTSTLTGQLNANGGIVTNNTNINAGTGTITSGNINGQTISSSANFTGTLAVATSISTPLLNVTSGSYNVGISSATQTGNVTLTIPVVASGSDEICLKGVGNCSGASGAAGGDLSGTYPNPKVVGIQSNPVVFTGLSAGDVLQYDGTDIVNGKITNTNFAVNTALGNVTGVGALTSGSIASGFGTISTGNDITTTATIQGGTLNGTSVIELNGTDINTAGTLTDVAYLDQANSFSQSQTISAAGGKTTLQLTSTGANTGITFGGDTNLYRSGSLTLTTDSKFLSVRSATNPALATRVTSDTSDRFQVLANGTVQWGSGTAAADTNLYRSAANTLKTDDSLVVGTNLSVTGTSTLTGQLAANGGIVTNNASINAGTGTITSGAVNGQTISSAANFTGTLAVATSVSTPTLNITSGSYNVSISSATQANNVTLTIPTDANPTDTICLQTKGNCSGASGAAGGDLSGTYPNPTVSGIQNNPVIFTGLSAGDVLQYDGTDIVNGKITDSNLQGGTYASITGTGALTSGSIGSGFGTISTGNNITTTATIQGSTINGTTALELNGTDINTAGTLSNVAYVNKANTFTQSQTISAAGGKTTLALSSTGANTGITLGGDTNLYRSAANTLTTDGSFLAGNSTLQVSASNAGVGIGSAPLSGVKLYVYSSGVSVRVNQVGTADLLELQNNGSNVFTVSNTGATTLSSTLAVTGATTLTGQLNANGGIVTNNTSINAGTGTITSGNINGQTISLAANFTGTLAVAGNTTIGGTLGVTGNVTGGTYNGATITSTTFNTATISGGSLSATAVNGLGLTSSAITGTGALSISAGGTNQDLSLQGSGTGGVIIQTPTFHNANGATYSFDATDASGVTATICTTQGNCAGSGGGITGSGTPGEVAFFNGTGSITSDSGLAYSSGNLTASGTIQGGSLALTSGGNTLTLQAGAGNLSLTFPAADGANGDCLETDGAGTLSFQSCTGGAGGGVTSLDGLAGVLILNNSSGSGSHITIDDASTSQKGIAEFNSTNFSASGGVINTIQDIATTSSPSFNALTLTGQLNANGGIVTNGASITTGAGNITSSATIQGNVISAIGTGAAIKLNGTNINSNGVLSNVAYLGASSQTFTGANTFSGTGTALSVTNNATIGGTLGVTGAVTGGTYNGQTISSAANFTGTLTVAGITTLNALGTADTNSLLCLNSTNQIASCTGSGSGTPFVQGGNHFGATGVLGTTDNFGLNIETDGNTALALDTSGNGTLTGNLTVQGTGASSFAGTLAVTGATTLTGQLNANGGIATNGANITTSNGTINTGSGNITSTGTVQGAIVNATSALELNGANINTAGTLSNVAYINKANTFTQPQTVNATSTATSGSAIGGTLKLVASPTSSSSAFYYGSQSTAIYNGTAANTGSLTGGYSIAQQNAGSGVNVSILYGSYGVAQLNSAGSVGTANGVTGVTNTSAAATGTITSAVGVRASVQNNSTAGASFTNAYGVYVQTPIASATGTIGTDYGIYIQAQAGTGVGTAYGLYQAGSSDLNVLAGATSINNTLSVSGAASFTAAGTALSVTNNASIGGTLAVTGAVTGGTYNGQTISSAANFTGTLAVATSVSTPLLNITSGSYTVGISSATQSGNVTLSIPTVASGNDIICLQTVGNCAATGSNFIVNGTGLQTNANFNIQSAAAGSIGGVIRAAAGQTADLQEWQDSSGNMLARVTPGGSFSVASTNGYYFSSSCSYLHSNSSYQVILTDSCTGGTKPSFTVQAAPSQTGDLLQLQSNGGTVLSHFDVNGNLAIGSASAPNYPLDVTGNINTSTGYLIAGQNINTAGTLNNVAYLNQANTFTNNQTVNATSTATSGTAIGTMLNETASPSSSSTANYYGSKSASVFNGTAATTGLIIGAWNVSTQNAGSGVNLGTLYGSYNETSLQNAGGVNTAIGAYGLVDNATGSTGNATAAVALRAQVNNKSTAGAAFTLAYGLQVMSPTASATGTIGTAYGIYIQAQAGTGVGTAYGLYQAGSSDLNVLKGATTINNTLTVSGAASFTAAGTGLSVTNNATIGGTLAVTGAVTGGTYNGQTLGSATSLTGTLTVAGITTLSSLGAADTNSALCLNSTNQIATCAGSGSGAAFVQGGNSFNATGVLGTTDNYGLNIETDGNTALALDTSGNGTLTGNLTVSGTGTSTIGGKLKVNTSLGVGATALSSETLRVQLASGTGATIAGSTCSNNGSVALYLCNVDTSQITLAARAISSQTGNLFDLQNSSGTNLVAVTAGGYLTVAPTASTATSGSVVGSTFNLTASPSSASSAFFYASESLDTYNGTAANTGSVTGAINQAAQAAGSGVNVSLLNGSLNTAVLTGAGTVGSAIGTYGQANIQAAATGSITNAIALRAQVNNNSTGGASITNAYGLQVLSPVASATGTIGTDYGVYISPQAGTGVTTAYGLYQAGSSDLNYLAGNTGIGATASANEKLVVSSSVTDPSSYQYGTHSTLNITQTAANSNTAEALRGDLTVSGSGGNTGLLAAVYGQATYNNTGTGGINGGEFLVNQGSSGGGLTIARGLYTRVDNNSTNAIATAYGLQIANNTGTGSITNNIGLEINALSGTSTAYGIQVAAPTATTAAAINLSDTGGTAAGGLLFGTDTNLYRSAANTLKTDDSLIVGANLNVSGNSTLTGTLSVGGLASLSSLGTADTNSALCLNSTNQIATCAGSGSGAAFVQGGNNFGAQAVLGTKDNNSLALMTNNATRAVLDTSGNLTFQQASTISTSTGNLTLQAAGTSTLTLDTAGAGNINIGTNASTIRLGNGTGTETVYVGNSSGTDTVNIATGGGTDTVNIGTSSNSVSTNIYSSPYIKGGVNATGYVTSNTGSTYSGQYTLLGTCTLVAQYQDCHSEIAVVNTNDGTAQNYHTTVDFRVKQQAALGGAPIVNLTLDGTKTLTASQFTAVTTENDGSATVVSLYLQINNSNQVFDYNPLINTGSKQVAWVGSQSFSTTLPAGTQTAAVYSTDISGGLTIQPASDAANVLQVENAAATSTLFSVDTLHNVVGVGAVPSTSGATLQVSGSLSAGSAAQFSVDTSGNVTTSGIVGIGQAPSAGSQLSVTNTVTDPAALQNGIAANLNVTQTAANSQSEYGVNSHITLTGSGGNSGIVAALQGLTTYNNSGAGGNINGGEFSVVQGSSGGGITTARGAYSRVDNNSTNAIATALGLEVANNTGTGSITNNVGLRIDALSGTSTAYGIQIAAPTGATTKAAINLSDTSDTSAGGILFGTDTTLYRSGTNTLFTSGTFTAGSSLIATSNVAAQYNGSSQVKIGAYGPSSQAAITFGSAADTTLYRSAAGVLQTAGSLTVGTAISTPLLNITSGSYAVGINGGTQTGNYTLSIPTLTANDTICTLGAGCGSASGTAGGDLTGSYPNPTIAKLQGKTLTVSTTPTTGAVLQYNGSAFVDGQITNTNFAANTTLGNVTGTGALSSGSIASGFGTIATGNTITGTTLNGTTGVNTGAGAGTQRIDASGNLTNIGSVSASGNITTSAGNITATAGTLAIGGTGSSYIMGPLGLGTSSPQAGSALTLANGSWITGVTADGSSYVNMFRLNSNNTIDVGAALNVDGGLVLPTDGGQLTLVDLPTDSSATAGTPESYTFRVGSTNVLTVYGEADGAGGAQNTRVAIGSSITPQYPLDVTGDINTSTQYRIAGTVICTSSGCTPTSGSTNYIWNGASVQSGAQFNIGGNGVIGGTLSVSGASTLTGAVTGGAYNGQTISSTASLTGTLSVATSVTTPTLTSTGALAVTGGTTLTLKSTTTNAVTLDSGTTGAVNIGTSANAKTVTIGNGTGATSVVINAGTGALNVGTNATAHTTTVGSTTTTSTTTIQAGTGGINLNGAVSASSTLAVTGAVTGGTYNTATISGGSLSSTAVNGLSVSSGVITNPQITGTITGVSTPTITGFGTYNGQTISASASFTGTLSVATSVSAPTLAVTNGSYAVSIVSAAQTGNRTLTIPALSANATLCTTDSVCAGYAPSTGGNYIAKGTPDSSSAAVTGGNNLLLLTNSNTGVASGVLSLVNAGTSSALSITQSSNPTSGQALILANNTNATPTGNLIDLQNKGVSEFNVDKSGNSTQLGLATTVGLNAQSGLIQGAAGLTVTGGSVNLNANSNNSTNINTGSSTGSINVGNSGAGAISLQSGSSITLNGATSVSLQSSTAGTISVGTANQNVINVGNTTANTQVNLISGAGLGTAGDINIGANANTSGTRDINIGSTGSTAGSNVVNIATSNNTSYAQTVNIGTNTTGNSSVLIQGGTTGSVALQTGAGGTINVGTAANNTLNLGTGVTSGTIKIGGTSTTGTLTVGQSTATNTISIGSAAGNGNTQTINIGTSSTAGSTTNVTIGSTIGSSSLTLQGGSNGINLMSSAGGVNVGTTGTATSLNVHGATLIQALSTTALQVQDTSGGTVLSVDTQDDTVAIGTPAGSGAKLTVYTGYVGLVVDETGSNDIMDLQNNGTNVLTVGSTGNTTIKTSTDGAGALQVQDHTGYTELGVDTLNDVVSLGSSTSLTWGGDTTLYRYVANTLGLGTGDSLHVSSTSGSQYLTLQSAATTVYLDARSGDVSQWVLDSATTADTQPRYILATDGTMQWGGGSATPDVQLSRTGVGSLTVQSTTNSTTAFQIQNATNTNTLFDADTQNAKINVSGSLNVGTLGGNRLFTDGFESGNFGLWDRGTSDPSISTSTVYDGKYSAQFTSGENVGETFGSDQPTVYLGAWVYVSSQSSTQANLMAVEDSNGYYEWDVYRTNDGKVHLFDGVTGSDVGSGGNLTTGSWHYIQERVTTGSSTGVSQLWLDGTQIVNASSQNNGTLNFGDFFIGDYTSDTFTTYIDDVTADTSQITTPTSALSVDDSLHVGGTASFGGSVLLQNGLGFEDESGNGDEGLIAQDGGNLSIYNTGQDASNGIFLQSPKLAYEDTLNGFTDEFTIQNGGQTVFKTAVDSSQALQVENHSGSSVLDVDTSNKRVGINNSSPSYALDVSDNQSSTYVARINNTNTGNNADGLLINLGVSTGSRGTNNYYVGFGAAGTIAGKIQGSGTAVVYNTSGSDYAEYFLAADPANKPQVGQIVSLSAGTDKAVQQAAAGDNSLVGVISGSPGFLGNGPICAEDDDNCDSDYQQTNVIVGMTGQLPVDVSAENGAIAPGDPIAIGSTPGVGVKATGPGTIIGYAMESFSGSGTGQIQVKVSPTYYGGPSDSSYVQNGGDATLNSLTIGGTADMASLNVSGNTTLTNLTVTGSANIASLTVADLTVTGSANIAELTAGSLSVTGSAQFTGDITVGGHIITAGGQPTAQSGGSIGTGASVAVEGTDTTGTITITTGSNPSAGDLAKILFSKTYGAAPHVVLSPSNDKASDLHFYKGATTSTDFMFDTTDTPAPNTTYTFDYFIAQ